MNKYISIFLFVLPLFAGSLPTACTEPIDLKNDGMEPKLVINCILTDTIIGPSFILENKVTIVKTTSFFGNDFVHAISGAKVWLNSELLTMESPGIYSPKEGFCGIPGASYTLEVHYDLNSDGADEIFTATTVMPQKCQLDSITFGPTITLFGEVFAFLFLHFEKTPGTNYYGAKLNNENDYRFYSSRILRYCLLQYDAFAENDDYLRVPAEWYMRHALPYDNETRYYIYAGDTLTVALESLSQEYHRFLEVAKTELSQNNPMFSGPRSNIPTNFSGGALGVLGAYTSSRASLPIPLNNTLKLPVRPDRTR